MELMTLAATVFFTTGSIHYIVTLCWTLTHWKD